MTFPYQPKITPVPYGLHVPYNLGYDARSRASAPKAEQKGASGYLQRPDGARIELWITEISADFALSGQTGQSRMLREFFPRSFNDVTLQITGNVASTQEYNRLALYVREHHWSALRAINNGSGASQTITFGLGNTYDNGRAWPDPLRNSSDVIPQGETTSSKQSNVKGPHRPWNVSGYISSIAAGATRWETAPEFALGFIVTASTLTGNTGIWSDTPDNGGSTLKSFMQILASDNGKITQQGSGFTQDPVTPSAPATAKTTTPGTTIGKTLTWSGTLGTTVLSSLF